ncbi:hypothetical protein GCM10022251_60780 [Phytohabitans flavus]|uniref:N-acetyltransferase domain-containing protein n=1 Tax=Phytohabitans flavus TaxID=1076124 RepID=A0A6F8Y4I2_9ACTN|nr:GNAT family N-acetyltransferase [Phytohabitans flavus]BCB80967.1 hypothetical protein Pflav_073770 [Phytohabitans flavus]
MVTDISIRLVTEGDLSALAEVFGQRLFFADRLRRQREGKGELRVAFWRGDLIGGVYLWLEPAEEPELRLGLPRVPLLQHLEVREDLRNHGFGTALVLDAEDRLRKLGHPRVALGVDLHNHDAARLYNRLGYMVWRSRPVVTVRENFHPDGSRSRTPELCLIYVKDLVAHRKT